MAYPLGEKGLVIHERREGPCVVLEIAGELDMNAVPRLRAELDTVLESVRQPWCIVLDLTQTTFCDSRGLGLLVQTYNRVRGMGGRMGLAVAPGMVSRLLMITNLDRHFETFATTEAALAMLRAA
jgi:anti-sigma B factor antagonist